MWIMLMFVHVFMALPNCITTGTIDKRDASTAAQANRPCKTNAAAVTGEWWPGPFGKVLVGSGQAVSNTHQICEFLPHN